MYVFAFAMIFNLCYNQGLKCFMKFSVLFGPDELFYFEDICLHVVKPLPSHRPPWSPHTLRYQFIGCVETDRSVPNVSTLIGLNVVDKIPQTTAFNINQINIKTH